MNSLPRLTRFDVQPGLPRPPDDPLSLVLGQSAGWEPPDKEPEAPSDAGDAGAASLPGAAGAPPRLRIRPAKGQALRLPFLSGTGRRLTEPSGSLGGLRLPSNVALGPDQALYLLDQPNSRLKRFDPCACRFETLPCFGPAGAEARALTEPRGIAIHRGDLYVCDTGNGRVTVLGLFGLVLRAHWRLPKTVEADWAPTAIAFNRHGQALVADRANGTVHCFDRRGRHLRRVVTGLGPITHLALDCGERLYVWTDDPAEPIKAFEADGSPAPLLADVRPADVRPAMLADRFECSPIAVNALGHLDLTAWCAPPASCGETELPGGPQVFDLRGEPLGGSPTGTGGAAAPVGERVEFEPTGSYFVGPLDSLLDRCQWHRVVLRGTLPPGTRIRMRTHSAEVRLDDTRVNDALDTQESNGQVVTDLDPDGAWDGLIFSGPGRFLWLRLELVGGGNSSPEIEEVRLEFPRISLRRYLPAAFGTEPASADFTDRFLSLFDTTLRSVEAQIDQQATWFDPDTTPDRPISTRATGRPGAPRTGPLPANPSDRSTANKDVDGLSWLASWIGVTLDPLQPVALRRRQLRDAAPACFERGTLASLQRQLGLFLGLDDAAAACRRPRPTGCPVLPSTQRPVAPDERGWAPPPLVLEHFRLRRWLHVGAARLGEQALLWGERVINRSRLDETAQLDTTALNTTQDPVRDPFHYFAHKFTVFLPAACVSRPDRLRLVRRLIDAEKPAPTQYTLTPVYPRFRIGVQSMIGFDAVVGRYPEDMVLTEEGAAPLGHSAVLGGAEPERPSRLGRRSRIGLTTQLS